MEFPASAIASGSAPSVNPMGNGISKTQFFNPMAQATGLYSGAGAYGGAPVLPMGNDPSMGHTLIGEFHDQGDSVK
jgi:hypothetical protein